MKLWDYFVRQLKSVILKFGAFLMFSSRVLGVQKMLTGKNKFFQDLNSYNIWARSLTFVVKKVMDYFCNTTKFHVKTSFTT